MNHIVEQITDQEQAPTARIDWTGILWYMLIACLFSWTCWFLFHPSSRPQPPLITMLNTLVSGFIALYGPAIAALLVRLFRRDGFADAGLHLNTPGKPKVWRWYLVAYLLPILILAIGLSASVTLGGQHWRVSQQTSFSPILLTVIMPIAYSIGSVLGAIATFGETFGWQGYLLPRLLPLGKLQAALITGLAWGGWFIPNILLSNAGFGAATPWLSIPLWTIVIVLHTIFFTWLSTESGSIWPAALAYAVLNSGNALITLYLPATNRYLGSPRGLATIIPFALLDLWIVWRWLKPGTTRDSQLA